MENLAWLDGIVGLMAIAILIGGLAMLFSGVSAFDKDKKK